MNRDQTFVALWTDYLEGELDEAGIAQLRQLLESDAEFLETAVDEFQTHRLLGLSAHDNRVRHEAFVKATMARLPAMTMPSMLKLNSDRYWKNR